MTSVQELDNLCKELVDCRHLKDQIKKKLKEVESDYKDRQAKIMSLLESLKKTENEGEFGKFKIVQREYYKMIDKEATFNWLREIGEFDNLATVNAATFSSYTKSLVQEKRDAGDFVWVPPGVEDATSDYTYLKYTEKK